MNGTNDSYLDHQYNTRAWAPDYADTIARHGRLGEAVRARPGARLDVRWGSQPRQTLDFFTAGASRGSLALFIHGGYWQYRTSTKHSVSFLAPPFLQRGIAFCAVSYELCPDVSMDAMVMQLREAVRWVRGNAALLGFVTTRLTVLGHSAGGHLAAMLALTSWTASDDSAHEASGPNQAEQEAKSGRPTQADSRHAPARLVDAACGVSGLYELEPIARTYLNEPLRMDGVIAARNSPIHLTRAGAPPMVLGVGALESLEFHRQTEVFGSQYPAPVFPLAGKDHYNATEALLEPGPFQEAVMRVAA